MADFSLTGNLNFLNLGELLQIFGTNGSTGVLIIKSKYSEEPGRMYFVKGNLVNAEAGSKEGVDAALALFGWTEGEFEFRAQNVKTKNVIQKSRMEITLDALRLLDDGRIEKLGPVTYAKTFDEKSEQDSLIPVIRGPLVDYTYVVEEEEYRDGDKIVTEGKYGNWIWVVLEGKVEIVKETKQEQRKIVALTVGSFVGTLSTTMPGQYNVRTASVVAVGSVQLGLLDSQRLYSEYIKLSPQFKEIILSLGNRMKQITGMVVDVSSKNINSKALLKGKKILIDQGSNDDRVFTIIDGEATVVRTTDNRDLPLMNLSAGDLLGHIPFINIGHEPHSASVFVSKDFNAKEIDKELIQKEYDQLSLTFKNMLENMGDCISATTMIVSDFHRQSLIPR
jgi:CRP-like cAMP-binding protein